MVRGEREDHYGGGSVNVRLEKPAIALLIQEYEAWNAAQGLNLGSADEHLFDATLTAEQRMWLTDFCERWDHAA